MAIFGKNGTKQAAGHGSTIIAAGTKLVGDLSLSDRLHVDGRIDGDVRSDSDISLGEQGKVTGTIRARRVVVSGHVDGSIVAERLEIVSGGVVDGDVHIVDLVIEPGGRFNGSSEILSSEREAGPAPAASSGGKKPGGVESNGRAGSSDPAPSAST